MYLTPQSSPWGSGDKASDYSASSLGQFIMGAHGMLLSHSLPGSQGLSGAFVNCEQTDRADLRDSP